MMTMGGDEREKDVKEDACNNVKEGRAKAFVKRLQNSHHLAPSCFPECVRFISGPESQDKLRISFFAEG
ncbi:hypothetical protein C0Q70_15712 [Pomacea canaliculata]|uniref:Uncharacterized protein n=1 Tax=Pomacea canaliculata TaxID=400727 RepID=A0A2T7NVN5_POMCA|nr:hypothetical protein C0Q70_15712 [Pomacea canaliculata]